MHHHAVMKPEKGCRRRWPAALPSMTQHRGYRGSIHTLGICECVLSAHRRCPRGGWLRTRHGGRMALVRKCEDQGTVRWAAEQGRWEGVLM